MYPGTRIIWESALNILGGGFNFVSCSFYLGEISNLINIVQMG